MRVLPAIAFLAACAVLPAQFPESGAAQEAERVGDRITELRAALAAGDLVVTNVRGNGASSGTVLDGSLRNTTARSIRVGVRLSRGLYFANRTATAQNMIATAVYERDGLYYVEDDEPFIEVLPRQTTEVTFNGYCLNFDRENPADTDSLVLQPVPAEGDYIPKCPTVAAQSVALLGCGRLTGTATPTHGRWTLWRCDTWFRRRNPMPSVLSPRVRRHHRCFRLVRHLVTSYVGDHEDAAEQRADHEGRTACGVQESGCSVGKSTRACRQVLRIKLASGMTHSLHTGMMRYENA